MTGAMTTDREGDREQDSIRRLDEFLASVERRALIIAEYATRDCEEALDVVQDVMTAFVRRYRAKPAGEWRPLFYRALDNRIKDWHRRRQARFRWFGLKLARREDDAPEPVEALADPRQPGPERAGYSDELRDALEQALIGLPERQRQAFLLRTWEGMSVAETASAMNCSEGSVKTHLSRAMHTLRQLLERHRP